jgi:hypothetical protein
MPRGRTGYVYGSCAQLIEHGQVPVLTQLRKVVYHGVANRTSAYQGKSDNDAKADKPITDREIAKHTGSISCPESCPTTGTLRQRPCPPQWPLWRQPVSPGGASAPRVVLPAVVGEGVGPAAGADMASRRSR